jgi:uncharacterized protein (TIGR02646 family)
MRAITQRGSGGFELNRAHAKPPTTSAQARSRWVRFGDKPAVLQALLDEQYQLCCYSELRADQEGLGYHIEHLENKSQAPVRTFDYSNLAASVLRDDELQRLSRGEAFGGHAAGKQQAPDMAMFVECHQPDCARYFSYLSDGRVVPSHGLADSDQAKAIYTIETLNLNSAFLQTRRKQWWAELDDLFQDHLAKGWSLPDLAAVDLVPARRELSRFFSLTRQFFGPIAEQVLRQCVSELE